MPDLPAPQLQVTKAAACRFLLVRSGVGRYLTEPDRDHRFSGGDVTETVRALEYVQVDPMRVLECNHHLVLGARMRDYRPELLDDVLYGRRQLVEVVARNRYIVPVEDYWMFRARFAEIERTNRPRLGQLESMMERVLRQVEERGAMSSLDFDDDERVSGWWEPDGEQRTRAVRQAMEWLWHFGRLAISHRAGTRRYFDLPERLYGKIRAEGGEGDHSDEFAALLRKYFRATGLVDLRDWGFGWARYGMAERKALAERFVAAGELVPVAVEGVKAAYFVPAAEAGALARAGDAGLRPDVHILPPLDNLTWLRPRLADLFGFDYTWEAYVPRPKRAYGPYTCPVLLGDRFCGRIDAKVDRDRGVLVVNGLWWEPGEPQPKGGQFEEALRQWAAVSGANEVDASAAAGPTR